RRLIVDDGGEPRVRVAERRDADPRQQVEVFTAVDVIEARTLPAHERHRLTLVGLQDVALLAGPDVVECHFHRTNLLQSGCTAFRLANVSNSRRRPLATSTSPTPCVTASRHAWSLATIPLLAVPAFTSCAASRDVRRAMVRPSASSTPAVPPAMTRR